MLREGLLTEIDCLAYYIKNDLNGIIPEEYVDFQRRINLVNRSKLIAEESNSNINSNFLRYYQRKKS